MDSSIFIRRYFARCLECSFCHDACCFHGVDIDVDNVRRINSFATDLEEFMGTSKATWFRDEFAKDVEFPGGSFTRTQVLDGACVFHDRRSRGCLLHKFSLENNIDYHDLKPMVSCLFPLTFDNGVLHPSDDIETDDLVCAGEGPTLYQGVRNELLYYFGPTFVEELDGIEIGNEVASTLHNT